MKLSEAHVRVVRSTDKTKAKKNKATKSAPAATKTSSRKKSPDKRAYKADRKALVLSIRAAHPTWSAAKIATEAKCKPGYVYSVLASKTTPAKTKKAATVTPAKKSGKVRGRKPAKKQLVLSLVAEHPDWTAAQIAKEAKCSEKYVYLTWKSKPKSPAKTATVTRGKTPAATTSASTTEFYNVLKRIGVEEAKRLIANIEDYARA